MERSTVRYWEQEAVWDVHRRNSTAETQRLKDTMREIPADIQSLLDVGCGSGLFVNACLEDKGRCLHRIVGVDLSSEALKTVKSEKYRCGISDMPFGDREFDMVTCLEVLEHIAFDVFEPALSEIARVARKYVLVTVPNAELLYQNLVICPYCYCCFSPWYHVRSFGESEMHDLVPGFDMIKCAYIGPVSMYSLYHPGLIGVNLLYRRPKWPADCVCPQCHYSQGESQPLSGAQRSVWRRSIADGAATIVKSLLAHRIRKRRWLLALYKRP